MCLPLNVTFAVYIFLCTSFFLPLRTTSLIPPSFPLRPPLSPLYTSEHLGNKRPHTVPILSLPSAIALNLVPSKQPFCPAAPTSVIHFSSSRHVSRPKGHLPWWVYLYICLFLCDFFVVWRLFISVFVYLSLSQMCYTFLAFSF